MVSASIVMQDTGKAGGQITEDLTCWTQEHGLYSIENRGEPLNYFSIKAMCISVCVWGK